MLSMCVGNLKEEFNWISGTWEKIETLVKKNGNYEKEG